MKANLLARMERVLGLLAAGTPLESRRPGPRAGPPGRGGPGALPVPAGVLRQPQLPRVPRRGRLPWPGTSTSPWETTATTPWISGSRKPRRNRGAGPRGPRLGPVRLDPGTLRGQAQVHRGPRGLPALAAGPPGSDPLRHKEDLPMKEIRVTYPDGQVRSFPFLIKASEALEPLGALPRPLAAVLINNELCPLDYFLTTDCTLAPVTVDTNLGAVTYRRSLCFLLAMASRELFPRRRLVAGMAIGTGFFHFFDDDQPDDPRKTQGPG
ncbi:MAG: hypothetical protein M0C28_22745 [Candidatus Moduliflexus flocculans]|nr:hypothetical protein [Candidatus Moduliflexus flocculans]